MEGDVLLKDQDTVYSEVAEYKLTSAYFRIEQEI